MLSLRLFRSNEAQRFRKYRLHSGIRTVAAIMSKKQFEAGSPSPMNPIPTTSNYDMLDVGLHTPEIRESFSAPVSANGEISDHGRFRSASVCGFGGEAARLEETRKRYQRMQNVGLSIEYRLSRLEKEHLRLLSATT